MNTNSSLSTFKGYKSLSISDKSDSIIILFKATMKKIIINFYNYNSLKKKKQSIKISTKTAQER
jgi:hypothetical protein